LIASTGTRNASIDLKAAEERGVRVVHTGYNLGADDRTEPGPLSWQCPQSRRRERVAAQRWMASSRSVMTWPGGRSVSWVSAMSAVRWHRIGNAFGMKVIAWSQNLTTGRAAEVGATLVSRDELFQEADVVTIHLVLSGRTRGLVGAAELALMKRRHAW